jgi:hypothetical protein
MSSFTLEVETHAGGLFLFDPATDTVTYWVLDGLPDYEGGMEGFAALFPDALAELVARKVLKSVPI